MPVISRKGLEMSNILDKLVINLWGNFQILVVMNCWTEVRAVILISVTRKMMDIGNK